MSYILDALRRAEAERERERSQVPGLHAQPLVQPAAPRGPAWRRWSLPLIGLVTLAVLAVVLAGRWSSGDRPSTPLSSPPLADAAPPAAAPRVPLPAPASAVVTPPAYTPPPNSSAEPTRVAAAAPPLASQAPMQARVISPPTSPTAPVPAHTAKDRIPRLAELPESTRQALPRLAISGSIYSEDAASRFVIINGDVAREGAVLATDLVLEQIRPRELVMRFRGQRYLQPV